MAERAYGSILMMATIRKLKKKKRTVEVRCNSPGTGWGCQMSDLTCMRREQE